MSRHDELLHDRFRCLKFLDAPKVKSDFCTLALRARMKPPLNGRVKC